MNYRSQSARENFFSTGPLTLDVDNKKAYTTIGTEVSLTVCQFDMLYALAVREHKSMSFQAILDSAYNSAALDTDIAHKELYRLIKIIETAGMGFMWIEKTLDRYSFVTNWKRAKTLC